MKMIDKYKGDKSDEWYTPPEAVKPLLDWIPKNKIIWEGANGTGRLKKYLISQGYTVVSSQSFEDIPLEWDILITNPPWSLKTEFLKKACELGKPFALLLPVTTLEGQKRQELIRGYNIQMCLFPYRIKFYNPLNQKAQQPTISSFWFTKGLSPDSSKQMWWFE